MLTQESRGLRFKKMFLDRGGLHLFIRQGAHNEGVIGNSREREKEKYNKILERLGKYRVKDKYETST